MLYSQMSPEQRETLFGDPAHYPFHVNFLGKYGILSEGEISLLREHGIDFDVDDDEVANVLGPGVVAVAELRRSGLRGLFWIPVGVLLALSRALVVGAWRSLRGH